MAEVTPQMLETFYCSICLDVLKDPVTIPCGHSYCMSCVSTSLDTDAKMGVQRCPQCRTDFTLRPVLVKNTVLADLVEQLTTVQALPADHYAGPEDVACDFCTRGKLKAVKSCQVCLASYCEEHLQPHYDVAALQYHKLVDPSKKILDNICSLHGEMKKIFCRTDQQSICYLCFVGEHKGHDTVSAAAERTERQRQLEVSRLNIQQKIQEREKSVEMLKQEENRMKEAQEDCRQIFNELISFTQKKNAIVRELVRVQQRDELDRVSDFKKELQQEISELKRSDAELQELSRTGNLNQFLKKDLSRYRFSESSDSFSITIRLPSCFEDFTRTVSELKATLDDALATNVFLTVAEVEVLLSQSERFLKYSLGIPLDPNTAHAELLL
ncbi:LOW QUALITY PROTEIN: tripartite motif-containing protein 16-like [Spinachia spinachia]